MPIREDNVERKSFGEVITPIELVNDILDTLPDDVWSNPNLKWLDPCVGTGNFPKVIIERLIIGLSKIIPDEELRYKHIIENMIYVCELQDKNMFIYLNTFNYDRLYKMNTHCGSYLDNDFDQHMSLLGVKKFDIIVMNPPYNDSNSNSGSSHVLWDKFVVKALNTSLKVNGYLVAIHPSGWRNIKGGFKDIQTLLKSKEMLYLEMHNQKDGIKIFDAITRYDFYCLKNTNNQNVITKIKCQDGTIELVDISKLEFIPNGMFETLQKLIAKEGEETVTILRDCNYHSQREFVSNIKTEEFKYPCVNYIKKDDTTRFFYSSINTKGHFGIPKLIMSTGRIKSVGSLLDIKGEYGLTEFAFAIIDTAENLSFIKQAVDSKKFKTFMEVCAVNDIYLNKRIIAIFRKDFWKMFI